MRRHIVVCSIALLLAWSEGARAQTPRDSAPAGICFHAQPMPACSAFVLTNFGSYVVLGSNQPNSGTGTPLRVVADWGLMFNASARDAIGGCLFSPAGPDRLGVRP